MSGVLTTAELLATIAPMIDAAKKAVTRVDFHPTDRAVLMYELRQRGMVEVVYAGCHVPAGALELTTNAAIPQGHAILLNSAKEVVGIVKLNDHTP